MAQRVTGNRTSGYKDKNGNMVIWPQYETQDDSEYDEIVAATQKGGHISEARTKTIQANMDRRSIGLALTRKVAAHKAKRQSIVNSRPTRSLSDFNDSMHK